MFTHRLAIYLGTHLLWSQGHLIAQGFSAFDRVFGETFTIQGVEVGGSQLLIGNTLGDHVVEVHGHGVGDRHDGFGFADATS